MPSLLFTRAALLSGGFALLIGTTGPSLAMSDQAFLKSAIEGDNSEIMLGLLAEKNGGSPEAKTFGQTLQGDHAQARIQAVRLSDQMGAEAPKAATPDAVAEADKLKSLKGAAFDKEFADFMIKDHQKDISDFKSEAETGEGPVAKFARMSIPTLQKHLEMAQTLAKSGS